ncbi:MAG: hypothetical protein IJ055_02650 [Oscillospiraceae bacterium]|nr:hypothetical protein [Oscillospiraceae bacterium]
MEKDSLTLEEILKEYNGDGPAPEKPQEAAEKKPVRPRSAHSTKVSFLESAADEPMPMRVNVPSGNKPAAPEPPRREPVIDDAPKIRRMSDSTRAREIAREKKKSQKRPLFGRSRPKPRPEEERTYEKERPEGEYLYTQIHGARKAKRRKPVRPDDMTAVGTETLHIDLRDVVNVKQSPAPEPVKPVEVEPAPRAEKTSLDLSGGGSVAAPADLDVTIAKSVEEAAEETRRRQEITDRMDLESASDIREDIAELRDAITFRTMALTLVLLLSGYFALRNVFDLDWLGSISENMFAIIQTLLGFAAAVVCYPVLKNGFYRLVHFRADTDSLAAVALTGTMLSCILDIFGLESDAIACMYMPCAVLVLLLHNLGKLLIINREEINLRLAAARFDCYGMTVVDDEQRAETIARGVLGDFPILATMRHTDSLTNFRKYTYSADVADRFCHYAAPVTFLFALIVSVAVTLVRGESVGYGVTLFSMFACASGCAAITFVANLPLYKAVRRLTKNRALMLGYQSVDDFYDTNSLMTDAATLFPEGTVKIAGVKMYTAVRPEETLYAAASLAEHAGSVLRIAFRDVLTGKERKLLPVENYVYEDSMGLSGWIQNRRVLMGNRELMLAHNIEGMPSATKEEELRSGGKEVVYLSVSGNLSALFLVELHADKAVQFWAKQAVRHDLCLVLRSVDPMITLQRLSQVFDIPHEMIKLLPAKLHADYAEETAPVETMSASMASDGSFCNVTQLIVCAKVIRQASVFGIFIQAVTILMGLALVLMEAFLHLGLTPGWMLLFQGIMALVTILGVNIRRIF